MMHLWILCCELSSGACMNTTANCILLSGPCNVTNDTCICMKKKRNAAYDMTNGNPLVSNCLQLK